MKRAGRGAQFITAMVMGGATILSLLPLGCASSSGEMPRRMASGKHEPRVPEITAARLQECVESHHHELSTAVYVVHYHVQVDKRGRVLDVSTKDIPASARDFATCTRIVLRDMTLSQQVISEQWLSRTNDRAGMDRNALGTVTVMGAEVALEEILAGASGVNVLFAISIGLAMSGVKDIADAYDDYKEARRRCNEKRNECLETPIASKEGPKWKHSLCDGCFNVCMQNEGDWPSRIRLGNRWFTCK